MLHVGQSCVFIFLDVVEYGLELASTTSSYRKLIVASENNAKNYDQWSDRCHSKFLFLAYLKLIMEWGWWNHVALTLNGVSLSGREHTFLLFIKILSHFDYVCMQIYTEKFIVGLKEILSTKWKQLCE